MKYFLDTEFIEGFHKPLFGKRRHFIDLISIGIVAEDGREYYAISNEFDPKDADPWVQKNVLGPLEEELNRNIPSFARHQFNYNPTFKELLKKFGKSNKVISEEIVKFVNGVGCLEQLRSGLWPDMKEVELHNPNKMGNAQPEFYGYYADYDWVLFCSLFGRMVDLPDGFPMYCIDLKQMMDENRLSKEWKQQHCPDPVGEHNAIVDARWNKKLYNKII